MESNCYPDYGIKKPRYRGKGNVDPPPPHEWINTNVQILLNSTQFFMHNGKEKRIHKAINVFTNPVKELNSQLVVTHLTERF
jgi:hypothetical protein